MEDDWFDDEIDKEELIRQRKRKIKKFLLDGEPDWDLYSPRTRNLWRDLHHNKISVEEFYELFVKAKYYSRQYELEEGFAMLRIAIHRGEIF